MSERSWTEIMKTASQIASGVGALVFVYQYFQSAAQPDRQRVFLLLALVAVALLLALVGRRLLNWAISMARTAARLGKQNALLVASLIVAVGLLYLLLQRTQDRGLAAAIGGLMLAATGIALGAVRIVAVTRPSFLGLPAAPTDVWCYDFIEHFDDPSTIKSYEHSWNISVKRRAPSLGIVKPAIFEHPRSHGYTVLTYIVEQIPERVREVQLEFFTGILDEAYDEKTGQLQERSQFHTVPLNKIRFEIWVNEGLVFHETRDAVGWSEFKHIGGLVPVNNRLDVSFRTDAMGDPRWNWAVWAEPKLSESRFNSSAAG